jgi:predicted enzyme related to lactoylglutathione lyase
MANIEKHAPGSFCWFELATTDQNAAKKFYTSLFGWSVDDSPMGPDDFYSMFKLDGRETGAAYTMRKEQRAQGVPPHWMLYIAVADADQAVSKTAQLGGTVLAPAFDVMDIGRMAVIQDPTGAIFSVWQAKQHQGVTIGGVDNTVCWADLSTPDPERASQFYSGLFGWEMMKDPKDPSGYLHIKNGGDFIGGIPPAEHRNPNAPPHWLLYFQVADVKAATQKVTRLGGKVLMPPRKMENVGTWSIVADPQGAVFSLFKSAR